MICDATLVGWDQDFRLATSPYSVEHKDCNEMCHLQDVHVKFPLRFLWRQLLLECDIIRKGRYFLLTWSYRYHIPHSVIYPLEDRYYIYLHGTKAQKTRLIIGEDKFFVEKLNKNTNVRVFRYIRYEQRTSS
jgi:hypothetical protein